MSYPLEGIKVIELGQIIAGTYGGQVLSDLGAEAVSYTHLTLPTIVDV